MKKHLFAIGLSLGLTIDCLAMERNGFIHWEEHCYHCDDLELEKRMKAHTGILEGTRPERGESISYNMSLGPRELKKSEIERLQPSMGPGSMPFTRPRLVIVPDQREERPPFMFAETTDKK